MSKTEKESTGMSKGLKLLIGAGGIYVSFLSYGKLHEQIFKYKSDDGEKFTFAFFLQALGTSTTSARSPVPSDACTDPIFPLLLQTLNLIQYCQRLLPMCWLLARLC